MDKNFGVIKKVEQGNAVVVGKPFVAPVKPEQPTIPQKDKATELVEDALSQAIVHRVVTDDKLQKELSESANTIIKSKVNVIKAQADKEDKETQFNNKKGVCDCFGCNEAITPKWAVVAMTAWHNIMTAIWIIVGCFTFAPVTFVAKKITVIFKKAWAAIFLAILIYLVVLAAPIVTGILKSKGIL